MSNNNKGWIEEIILETMATTEVTSKDNPHKPLLEGIAKAFGSFPFMLHNNLEIIVPEHGTLLQCKTIMADHLVGNMNYEMLHGGVTATMLDSAGAVQSMAGVAIKSLEKGAHIEDVVKHISSIATLDFRIDYLKPGVGEYFIATCDIVRLGRKSCTSRLEMVNDKGVIVAMATGSYSY